MHCATLQTYQCTSHLREVKFPSYSLLRWVTSVWQATLVFQLRSILISMQSTRLLLQLLQAPRTLWSRTVPEGSGCQQCALQHCMHAAGSLTTVLCYDIAKPLYCDGNLLGIIQGSPFLSVPVISLSFSGSTHLSAHTVHTIHE